VCVCVHAVVRVCVCMQWCVCAVSCDYVCGLSFHFHPFCFCTKRGGGASATTTILCATTG